MKKIIKSLILLGVSFSLLMLSACKKAPISIPFGAGDCKGRPYIEIEAKFEGLGFKNIELVPVEDIVIGLFAKENMVAKVSIGGNRSFKKGDVVDPNQNVVISYHVKKSGRKAKQTKAEETQKKTESKAAVITKEDETTKPESVQDGMISVPLSAKECKNKEYVIIENNFKDAGFTNIELTPIEDNSFFGKGGKVVQISINGNATFKSGEQFKNDAKVRITYYNIVSEYDEEMQEYVKEEMKIVSITKKEDIIGSWMQTNNDEQRIYMAAIDEDTISVYTYFVDDDDIQVYWTGTFDSNIDITKKADINSENYRFITDNMLNASHADTKDFTYEDSKITFNVSYFGVSTDVVLEKDAEEFASTIKLTGDREPGFNETTNNTVVMGDIEIHFPSYFDSKEETSTDDYIEYFSKDNDATATLYVQNYILEEELIAEELADFIAYMVDSSEYGYQLLDMQEVQSNGINGITVLYSTTTGLALEVWYLVDGRQDIVIVGETFDYMDKTKHDYFTDFDSIVENISRVGKSI